MVACVDEVSGCVRLVAAVRDEPDDRQLSTHCGIQVSLSRLANGESGVTGPPTAATFVD